MIQPLKLREWTKSTVEELSPDEIADLTRIDGLRVEARSDGRFDVTPTGNIVGYVRRGSTSVVIHPSKCLSGLVVFMMGYADAPGFLSDSQVDFESDDDLLEEFVSLFVRKTVASIQQGLYRAYVSLDEELSVIRGRVRLSDQISKRFRLVPPISVTFDDYSVDNTENRIIKCAIDAASHLPIRRKKTIDDLQYLRAMFSDVTHVEFDKNFLPEPVWTRLNAHLKYPVDLAKRVIRSSSISLNSGTDASDEFLINMANVFEDFVVTALREELKLSASDMPRANEIANNPYLDQDRLIKLKPDISRWSGQRCVAIGDVKYKRTTADGVLHPDIYQLLAYSIATDLKRASVIYACGKGEREDLMIGTHHVSGAEIDIDVFALDLTRSSDEVLAQIAEIARAFEPQMASA